MKDERGSTSWRTFLNLVLVRCISTKVMIVRRSLSLIDYLEILKTLLNSVCGKMPRVASRNFPKNTPQLHQPTIRFHKTDQTTTVSLPSESSYVTKKYGKAKAALNKKPNNKRHRLQSKPRVGTNNMVLTLIQKSSASTGAFLYQLTA